MNEVFGLFPVPVMRVRGVLPPALIQALVEHFSSTAQLPNNNSANLSHTAMLAPSDSPLLIDVARLVTPKLSEFGALLFGEQMGWSLKEMWVNLLERGGYQAMHTHANSFISAVVYLTPTDPSSRTVFMRSPGGREFIFKNDHAGVVTGPYNAERWISPQPEPGDMVLFPSYLLHSVPHNEGERRITLAMNAIPARLDSWGYAINFSG
jgi:hypothetical protein